MKIALLPVITQVAALEPQLVASFPLGNAAVTTVAEAFPGSPSPALLATTFGVLGNPVYVVPDLKSVMSGEEPVLTELTSDVKWANYVDMAPVQAFGNAAVVATAGGFLVPGKKTGSIDMFEVSDGSAAIRTKISPDKLNYFYHNMVWYDMNGDGKLDVVAARATTENSGQGELIWLEQPQDSPLSRDLAHPWTEHILVSGPDVDFVFEDFDGDGLPELVATQFFSTPNLVMYSCGRQLWSECDGSTITAKVIDDVSGPFFTVQRVDLNKDGKPDLLVTNNQADNTGSLFAYEQPSDLQGDWKKHVLSTGYEPYKGGVGKGSPGNAEAFHITVGSDLKPEILMSGDDGGFVSLFKPSSSKQDDWSYTETFLLNSTGTIGTPSISDLDGDGISEVIVPFYSDGKIEIYTFGDEPAPEPSAECVACLDKKDPVHLSSSSAWCFLDGKCHIVGSPQNPCNTQQCSSRATLSGCECNSCNDQACSLASLNRKSFDIMA